jgi:hypothetical protein
MQPTTAYVRPRKVKLQQFSKNIVPGYEFVFSSKKIPQVKNVLGQYPLSPQFTKLLNNG